MSTENPQEQPEASIELGSTALLDFKSRLKEARELHGMSQAEVAIRTGLQPSAISHFETGERKPSAVNIVRLCNAIGISSDWLLGIRQQQPKHPVPWNLTINGIEYTRKSNVSTEPPPRKRGSGRVGGCPQSAKNSD